VFVPTMYRLLRRPAAAAIAAQPAPGV
jgi:hypothetical protein